MARGAESRSLVVGRLGVAVENRETRFEVVVGDSKDPTVPSSMNSSNTRNYKEEESRPSETGLIG